VDNLSNDEVKAVRSNDGEEKSLHPGENLVNKTKDNLSKAEARVDEERLKTENTPEEDLEDDDDYLEDDLKDDFEDDDEEIAEDYYGDGDEGTTY
jgi:hypothetical protein